MSKMSSVAEFGKVKEHQNNPQSAGIRSPYYVGPTHSTFNSARSKTNPAFTIVELLIVIVIIGILAAITIVSYSGITQKANVATLQSDLTNASKKLNMYYASYNVYPASMASSDGGKTYCPTAPTADTNYCVKPSNDATFTYSTIDTSDFTILATKGNITYSTTKDSGPIAWVTIGEQIWASKNLNVGTRIDGALAQTNNSGANIIEKYCYNDDELNCTANGAFYQWDEAMQYTASEGARGICPVGSHIPTDAEWKILEMHLGMTQVEADKQDSWRGTDQGSRLKFGGNSGLDLLLSGRRYSDGLFVGADTNAYLWSSSQSSTNPWVRYFISSLPGVYRYSTGKSYGFSVRCLKD